MWDCMYPVVYIFCHPCQTKTLRTMPPIAEDSQSKTKVEHLSKTLRPAPGKREMGWNRLRDGTGTTRGFFSIVEPPHLGWVYSTYMRRRTIHCFRSRSSLSTTIKWYRIKIRRLNHLHFMGSKYQRCDVLHESTHATVVSLILPRIKMNACQILCSSRHVDHMNHGSGFGR